MINRPASKFVIGEIACFKIRIFVVLLELVRLHHHLALDAAVAHLAVVRDVQVVVVGHTG